MKHIKRFHLPLLALIGLLATAFSTDVVQAQSRKLYDFLAPADYSTFRMYRVNIYNGEMAVCRLQNPKGQAPFTQCRGAGPGAGPQKRGLYKLKITAALDPGVYRVNEVTGEMSICWLSRETDTVHCTEMAR